MNHILKCNDNVIVILCLLKKYYYRIEKYKYIEVFTMQLKNFMIDESLKELTRGTGTLFQFSKIRWTQYQSPCPLHHMT
jgi:hypothetical protein